MTDPDAVREQLRRLVQDESVASRDSDEVIERAAAVSASVETAAAFAADGGCERLAGAVEAAERDGEQARAARGRAVMAAFERFERACTATGDSRRDNGERADGEAPARDRQESLSPRSRNP